MIHRESSRASVLNHSGGRAVLHRTAQRKCLLTTPSLLSRGTRSKRPARNGCCAEGRSATLLARAASTAHTGNSRRRSPPKLRGVTSCGDNGRWLLQCSRMADWRQIQARIRKAKTSSDPPAQLAELYERTRDAMVAFELAAWQEKAGDHGEAARWYTSAAQRFRRAQWRTKAEEALTRLGAPIPAAMTAAEPAGETSPSESLGAGETTFTVEDNFRGGSAVQRRKVRWRFPPSPLKKQRRAPARRRQRWAQPRARPRAHSRKESGGADGAADAGDSAARELRAAGGEAANAGAPGPARSFVPAAASAPPILSRTPAPLPERPEPESERAARNGTACSGAELPRRPRRLPGSHARARASRRWRRASASSNRRFGGCWRARRLRWTTPTRLRRGRACSCSPIPTR